MRWVKHGFCTLTTMGFKPYQSANNSGDGVFTGGNSLNTLTVTVVYNILDV